jgi:hypothetical protein
VCIHLRPIFLPTFQGRMKSISQCPPSTHMQQLLLYYSLLSSSSSSLLLQTIFAINSSLFCCPLLYHFYSLFIALSTYIQHAYARSRPFIKLSLLILPNAFLNKVQRVLPLSRLLDPCSYCSRSSSLPPLISTYLFIFRYI